MNEKPSERITPEQHKILFEEIKKELPHLAQFMEIYTSPDYCFTKAIAKKYRELIDKKKSNPTEVLIKWK